MDNSKKSEKALLTPFLIILILVVSFVAGSLWQKVKTLEKSGTGVPNTTTAVQENRLSVENLKKYANELKLDTKKFNNCLDKDEKKELVLAEAKEGEAVGVSGTPAFFINGKFLGGAFPFELFKEIIDQEIAGKGSTNYKDYSEQLQKAYENPQGKSFDPVAKNVVIGNSPAKGPANAKVTIVEYSDFECPYCAMAVPTIKQVLEAYPNDIKFVFKQYPLPMHQYAQKAAEASLCAQAQGKFWEYHDKLFEGAN